MPRLLYKKEEMGWKILNEELVILCPNIALIVLGENIHKYILTNESNVDIKVHSLSLLAFDTQNLRSIFRLYGTEFFANVKHEEIQLVTTTTQ